LIESSLSHLCVFNFYFIFASSYNYDGTLNTLKQFQTNFWHKQHHWYTNYEISDDSASIYTIPYAWNEYILIPTRDRYSYSNQFDNVTKLNLSTMAMTDSSSYYFKNVKSLTLITECDSDNEQDFCKLQTTEIKSLNKIVNSSNIKHLGFSETCNVQLSSSLLLELLKELPYVSSLKIDRNDLKSFYNNHELCEYFNRKINTLYISTYSSGLYINSDEVDLLCKTFSNIEELHCYIEKLDDLLSIIRRCSKLSMINLSNINKHIYSWIQVNASKLNVYIDFISVQRR